MASPSPRSTRSFTPDAIEDCPSAHDGNSPVIMTPGRKIKAMLAAFDSDSDTEQVNPKPVRPKTLPSTRVDHDESENDQDEDLPVAPRGRLAARMHAGMSAIESPIPGNKTALSPQSHAELNQAEESDSDDSIFGFKERRPRIARVMGYRSPPSSRSSTEGGLSHYFATAGSSQKDGSTPKAIPFVSRLHALADQKRRALEQQGNKSFEKERGTIQSSTAPGLGGDDEDNEDQDDELDREAVQRLSQSQKPRSARKASKKAMLEMSRETQRIARSMQLAHEATTKKKISVESFLSRFNQHKAIALPSSDSTSDAPLLSSEADIPSFTPPTSPGLDPYQDKQDDGVLAEKSSGAFEQLPEESELPTLAALLAGTDEHSQPQQEQIPEQIQALSNDTTATTLVDQKINKPSRQVQVRLSREAVAANQMHDFDLEIVTSPRKARRLALFEDLNFEKAHDVSSSLRTLKALAYLPSKTGVLHMTKAEHDDFLLQKAREQAAQQREEKIAIFRAKGGFIQTSEERAQDEDLVENLVEKAREDAEQIAKQEKEASERARKHEDANVVCDLSSDEEEFADDGEVDSQAEDCGDLDYEQEQEQEQVDLETNAKAEKQGDAQPAVELYDGHGEENSELEDNDDQTQDLRATKSNIRRRNRSKLVVSDDEDDGSTETPAVSTPKPQVPNFGKPAGPLLGLSQVFAATLGNSQEETQEDSLAQLRQMPGIDLPVAEMFDSIPGHYMQAQNGESLDMFAGFRGANSVAADSPSAKTSTEYSELPEPTQDDGFVMSPFDLQKRFRSAPSTVSAFAISSKEIESGTKERKRLRRGLVYQASDSENDDQTSAKIIRKKEIKPFAKKKSKAKEMVEEAAEESDDEYAGLGGASDEDSDEEDEYDQQMINDNSGEVVDGKELAAINAHHELQRDEMEVNKLMRDITTGALRRKRGGGDALDLSDSDDERIARRRAVKRNEYRKMRKALLADEKLGKLAEDPKKQAFMKSIEDLDLDDDSDFLDEDDSENAASQGSSDSPKDNGQSGNAGDSSSSIAPRKRPFEAAASDVLNRLPAKSRRLAHKASMKKPMTLAEIRESVLFLTGGPDTGASSADHLSNALPSDNVQIQDDHSGGLEASDFIDKDDTAVVERPIDNPNPRRQKGRVVDRLALRRQASSNAASGVKLAFHSGANNVGPDFRSPPLLQRRSSSLSTVSSKSSSSSNSGSSVVVKESVAMQGSRKGAVNYYTAAREKERELQLKKNLQGMSFSKPIAPQQKTGKGLNVILDTKMGKRWV